MKTRNIFTNLSTLVILGIFVVKVIIYSTYIYIVQVKIFLKCLYLIYNVCIYLGVYLPSVFLRNYFLFFTAHAFPPRNDHRYVIFHIFYSPLGGWFMIPLVLWRPNSRIWEFYSLGLSFSTSQAASSHLLPSCEGVLLLRI